MHEEELDCEGDELEEKSGRKELPEVKSDCEGRECEEKLVNKGHEYEKQADTGKDSSRWSVMVLKEKLNRLVKKTEECKRQVDKENQSHGSNTDTVTLSPTFTQVAQESDSCWKGQDENVAGKVVEEHKANTQESDQLVDNQHDEKMENLPSNTFIRS